MDTKKYRKRLVKSILDLEGIYAKLAPQANSGHPESVDAINEQRRLGGKIEGVRLALSYLDETERFGDEW
jgi:hypothetical protein